MRTTRRLRLVLALVAMAAPGCGGGVDATYGRFWSQSVNGTKVLADLLRQRGHNVRSARRLNDELQAWADVIVRFSPHPGPVPKTEADWYAQWLALKPRGALVYIPRDYDAEAEYWDRALAQLPADATERTRQRIKAAKGEVEPWEKHLPPATTKPAPAAQWFAVADAQPPTVCKKLAGPWARGVDADKAALTVHQGLKVDAEHVLLTGDGRTLVMAWELDHGGRVLVAANGSFLLNLPLTEPARWPLAARTADWIDGGDERSRRFPRNIAFTEGSALTTQVGQRSIFDWCREAPFNIIMPQFFILGLAGCLALAPRLGRPRPDAPSGADRPVAHPEALGALLARTGRAGEARALLETYRRWRGGSHAAGSSQGPNHSDPAAPATDS